MFMLSLMITDETLPSLRTTFYTPEEISDDAIIEVGLCSSMYCMFNIKLSFYNSLVSIMF